MQEKLKTVEQFQAEACEEIARINQASVDPTQSVSTTKLVDLIQRGEGFEFHVPELDTLKLTLQQNQWVSETKEKLRAERQTIDGLKSLVKQGTNILQGSAGTCT